MFLTLDKEFGKAIIDSGCTKGCAGKLAFENLKECMSEEMKKNMVTRKDKRSFRFGNGVRYPSLYEVDIPFKLGKLETVLKVSIINANVPLLIALPDLEDLEIKIYFHKKTMKSKRTGEVFQLEKTPSGHIAIPFEASAIEEDENIFILDSDEEYKEKTKKIKKVHHVMCHPRADILKIFYKDSNENDKETLRAVDEVTNNCKICKFKYKKSPPRPKVALPVSNNFNQSVSIDLKGPTNKGYILYCVDTFSRLTRGIIIKDKNPSTIIKGLLDCWILGRVIGPGMPGKFIHDNGREFCNKEMIDLAEKF